MDRRAEWWTTGTPEPSASSVMVEEPVLTPPPAYQPEGEDEEGCECCRDDECEEDPCSTCSCCYECGEQHGESNWSDPSLYRNRRGEQYCSDCAHECG